MSELPSNQVNPHIDLIPAKRKAGIFAPVVAFQLCMHGYFYLEGKAINLYNT